MDMDYRSMNKSVMDDTQMLCGNLDSLRRSIENSLAKEYVVYQSDALALKSVTANKDMKVIVSKERTYQAAEKYKGKKVCCLDFANYYSIGGAPWSAGAQEESMCRCSTLYPCLCARKQDFYEKHIREDIAGVIDYMGSDDLIFIPGVTVFKTDESEPKLMPEHDWYNVDVIVAAAPELDWDSEEPGFRKVMEQRIKRILDVASREGEVVLVLGAFGCGAFCNPPEVVADIFASLIRGYDFETVEFAVFCRDSETKNYSVFKAAMEKE